MLKFLSNSTVFSQFLGDRKGTAAIEFAFIAPVMIVTYFGLASISLLVSADRDVSHTASVTADLFTQSESLDEDDIEDIFNASLAVMGVSPARTANLRIDVISYQKNGAGVLIEVGYASIGDAFPSKHIPDAGISPSLLNTTSGLLITRIEYDYTGTEYYAADFTKVILTPTLSETFMLKPRKSATIPFSDSGGGSTVTCTHITVGGEARASC